MHEYNKFKGSDLINKLKNTITIYEIDGIEYNIEYKIVGENIPKYDENGIPKDYGNGFVNNDYGIDDWILSYPTKNVKLPECFDLVAWLKEHDFRVYKPKLFSQTVAVQYERRHSLLL